MAAEPRACAEPAPAVATIAGRLAHHATTRGQAIAFHIVAGGRATDVSYEALLRHAAGYAGVFAQAGLGRGDLIFMCLKHGIDVYAAYLGAMILGAVPSFLAFPTPKQDPALYWQTHRALFQQMGGRAVLTYPENRDDLAAALPPATALLTTPPTLPRDDRPLAEIAAGLPAAAPDDTVLVQFSSGTTGLRKGVALSHALVARQVASYAKVIGAGEGTRIASWLPLYHDMGLMTAFLMPVHYGATVACLDAFEWVTSPHSLLDLMDRQRCTHAWLPNFAFNHLVRTKLGSETYALGHVAALINCSEPCKQATFDLFAATFAGHGIRPEQLQVCYAMAETVFAVSQTPLGRRPHTLWIDAQAAAGNRIQVVAEGAEGAMPLLSNGPPIDGILVRIAGGEAIGEIQLRGDCVFAGYLKAPDVTAQAFDGGWYRTGDIGSVIDGEVYVIGRLKDIIIHHGRNYHAHDIEAVAGTVTGVKPGRCVALGVWDEEVGSEEVELVAERDPSLGIEDKALRNTLRQAIVRRFNLAVSKVHLVEPGWLVKTTSGKISRKENLGKLLRDTHRAPAEPGK
jgi:acyl-CoA synthetase (AMP-forming)/AMP-acid ligase II